MTMWHEALSRTRSTSYGEERQRREERRTLVGNNRAAYKVRLRIVPLCRKEGRTVDIARGHRRAEVRPSPMNKLTKK